MQLTALPAIAKAVRLVWCRFGAPPSIDWIMSVVAGCDHRAASFFLVSTILSIDPKLTTFGKYLPVSFRNPLSWPTVVRETVIKLCQVYTQRTEPLQEIALRLKRGEKVD